MRLVGPGTDFPLPAHCSSCFQAKYEPHVDFEVVWDGPVLVGQEGLQISVDDMIVCAECLGAAGATVGLGDVKELTERISSLEASADARQDRVEAMERHAKDLERAMASRPEPAGV